MRKRITAGLLAVVFCIIAILPAGFSAQKGPSMVSRGFERAVIDGRQATRFVDSALAAESEIPAGLSNTTPGMSAMPDFCSPLAEGRPRARPMGSPQRGPSSFPESRTRK